MEYFIESTNLALLEIDTEYKLLCEASKQTNNEKEKSEISMKSDNLIKRAWNKVKLLIQRVKNFFFEKKVDKTLDNMSKTNEKCKIKVPEGETPKSFEAKIDLFTKKLKKKTLTREEVDTMKSKMAKGIMVTTTTVVAAKLGKKLIAAIPVCDALASEYDNEKLTEHRLAQKNKEAERTGHFNKYAQPYLDKNSESKFEELTGAFKYAATHMVSGVTALVQDGVGHIINSVENKDKDLPTKYADMSTNERIKANQEIKSKAKIKAASAKDKMNTYKQAMKDLKAQDKETSIEYATYKKKYDLASDEFKKYTKIYNK